VILVKIVQSSPTQSGVMWKSGHRVREELGSSVVLWGYVPLYFTLAVRQNEAYESGLGDESNDLHLGPRGGSTTLLGGLTRRSRPLAAFHAIACLT